MKHCNRENRDTHEVNYLLPIMHKKSNILFILIQVFFRTTTQTRAWFRFQYQIIASFEGEHIVLPINQTKKYWASVFWPHIMHDTWDYLIHSFSFCSQLAEHTGRNWAQLRSIRKQDTMTGNRRHPTKQEGESTQGEGGATHFPARWARDD